MATEKLFGNRIKPACKYCEHAMQDMGDRGMLLCEKRGIVSMDYACRHYLYDPVKRVPNRPLPMDQFKPEDFEL